MSSPLRLVRDLAALSGGELVSKVAGFAAFAYLARALTPEAYGAVELAVALALFFALIVDFGFGPIGAREIARDPVRAPSLAAEVPAARLLLAVLAVPGMGGLALALGQPPETVRVVWLFAASLLLAPWTQRWLLQGLDRMAWVSVAQALRMIVFAVGVVVFVHGPEDLLRVGLVEIAAAATMAGYFVVVQASTVAPVRLSFDRGALGRLWREARSVGASQVVWALNQYLPTVLVALLLGGADIAWFGGAHRIVLSLGTFVWLYHFNLFPSMARTTSRSPAAFQRLVEPSFRVTAWAGVIGALALGLLAGPLCRVAFGDAFGAAAAPFAVLAWVIPVGLLSGHARYALIASGNQRRELEAQLTGAAVIAIVGLAAIPPLGPLGGAVAMLASALAVWVVAHRATVRHVAPIPFLGPALRPLAVGGAAAALASWALASPWAAAAVMGAVSLAAAPLVDARLLRDLRALAGAKLGGRSRRRRRGRAVSAAGASGRAVAWRLFATAWIVYSLHFATNIVREYYPAFALAEHGTLRVDAYLGLHPDLFEVEGRGAFINNNPGSSMLAGPVYAVARPAVDRVVAVVMERRAARGGPPPVYDDPRPLRRRFYREVRERGLDVRFGLASGWIQAAFTAPLSALSVVVVHALLLRLGFAAGPALALALVYAFGTPVFFRSGFLNQNLLVAHLALFATALLLRRDGRAPPPIHAAAAGGLAGFGLVCDYSGAVPLAALGLYGLAVCVASLGMGAGLRRAAFMVAGGAASVSVLLAYQAWAFGSPWFPAQRYMPPTEYSGFGWNGVSLPALDLMAQNLFDPRFGLFVAGPFLLLAFGAPYLRRDGRPRLSAREAALVFGLSGGVWLFASSIEYARLQWNTGVRYLLPAVPLLFLAAATVWNRLPRVAGAALAAAAVGWCWAHAMVREAPLDSVRAVLVGGLHLPWLTSLGRVGGGPAGPLPGGPALPLLLAAFGIAMLWGSLRWRDRTHDESGGPDAAEEQG